MTEKLRIAYRNFIITSPDGDYKRFINILLILERENYFAECHAFLNYVEKIEIREDGNFGHT